MAHSGTAAAAIVPALSGAAVVAKSPLRNPGVWRPGVPQQAERACVLLLDGVEQLPRGGEIRPLVARLLTDQEIDQGKNGDYSKSVPTIEAMNAIAGKRYPEALGGAVEQPDFVASGGDSCGWPTHACVRSWNKICTELLSYPTRPVAGNHRRCVELDQAGAFVVRGYTTEETRMLLGTFCPTTLFPYAREAISSIVAKGGFPPLILQPINFDALYAQAGQQNQQA